MESTSQGANAKDTMDGIARLIHEVGHLKRVPRSGWALAGVSTPESVAEHVFRTAFIGLVLAHLANADAGRTALMCVVHDLAETRLGDVPSVGKKYIGKPDDVRVVQDQTRGCPSSLAGELLDLVREYEERETLEAQLARDADYLECLAQASEYVAAGHDLAKDWVDGCAQSVATPFGKTLAQTLRTSPPETWWQPFVQSYRGRVGDVADV
jgi:putative hydrolases of HD superfamily